MSMFYSLYIINITSKINIIELKNTTIILFYFMSYKTLFKKNIHYYRFIRRKYISPILKSYIWKKINLKFIYSLIIFLYILMYNKKNKEPVYKFLMFFLWYLNVYILLFLIMEMSFEKKIISTPTIIKIFFFLEDYYIIFILKYILIILVIIVFLIIIGLFIDMKVLKHKYYFPRFFIILFLF